MISRRIRLRLGLIVFAFAAFATASSAQAVTYLQLGTSNASNATTTLSGTTAGAELLVKNANGSSASAFGLYGLLTATAPTVNAAAVRGHNNATNAHGYGVWGSQSGSGTGVYGYTPSGRGLWGNTTSGTGVYGLHSSTSGAAAAVQGDTNSTASNAVGVLGRITSSSPAGSAAAVLGINNGTGYYSTGAGVRGTHMGYGYGVVGTSPKGAGVFGQSTNAVGVAGNSTDGKGVNGYSVNSTGIDGRSLQSTGVHGKSDSGYGVHGEGAAGVVGTGSYYGAYASASASGGYGLYGSGAYGAVGSGSSYGVYGSSSYRGLYGYGGNAGVYGTSPYVGLWSTATATSGENFALYTQTSSPSGWGGVLGGKAQVQGDLQVLGNLSKSSGSFKIDHPLDPANKYLQHSFVESPDMLNVYNGNVRTDAKGFATVKLPAYFQALNRDFRYQLTVIGSRGWNARVVKKIAHNRFTIQTDEPKVKVSWQVTGIRHDAWANAHRIQVETNKTGAERGKYLTPRAFGKPLSLAIRPSPDARSRSTEGMDATPRAQELPPTPQRVQPPRLPAPQR